MNTNKTEHLEFIYNRLLQVHKEEKLYDYMIKLRTVIEEVRAQEEAFNSYLLYLNKRSNDKEKN